VLPQADGSLLVLTDREREVGVLRLRPPDSDVTDSAAVPEAPSIIHAQAGDRVYFGIDSSLIALRGRTLDVTPELRMEGDVRAVAPTPSGDRLFVATDSSRNLAVVSRYRDVIERTIALPGPVSALRMDPLGRYVLARASTGDSAWVVAVGTARVIGSISTAWRDDLPFVAPDGSVALAAGEDVRIVDGETLRERAVIDEGAADFWHLVLWNGFRPRAGDSDPSATLPDSESVDTSATVVDSGGVPAPLDSQPTPATPQPPAAQPPPTTPGQPTGRAPRAPIPRPAPPRIPTDSAAQPARSRGWIVSFAAYVSEPPARQRAASISVGGQKARVVTGQTSGTAVYRVVLGPYPTKAEAERVGRESRESFWVYEDNP
jgi:cell division septation protein DedD